MISTRSVPMKDAKEGHAADLYDGPTQSAQCMGSVYHCSFCLQLVQLQTTLLGGCIDHWCDHCERRRCTACISGSVTVSPVTAASTAKPRSWLRFKAKCTGIGRRTEAGLRVHPRMEDVNDEDRPIERATVLQEHRRAPLKRIETRTGKVVVRGGGGQVRAGILPAKNDRVVKCDHLVLLPPVSHPSDDKIRLVRLGDINSQVQPHMVVGDSKMRTHNRARLHGGEFGRSTKLDCFR